MIAEPDSEAARCGRVACLHASQFLENLQTFRKGEQKAFSFDWVVPKMFLFFGERDTQRWKIPDLSDTHRTLQKPTKGISNKPGILYHLLDCYLFHNYMVSSQMICSQHHCAISLSIVNSTWECKWQLILAFRPIRCPSHSNATLTRHFKFPDGFKRKSWHQHLKMPTLLLTLIQLGSPLK